MLEVERGKMTSWPDLPTTFKAIRSTKLHEQNDKTEYVITKKTFHLPRATDMNGTMRDCWVTLIFTLIGRKFDKTYMPTT